MLELPVASSLGHDNPAFVRQQPHDIPNLHITITPLPHVESWFVRGCFVCLAMQLRLSARETYPGTDFFENVNGPVLLCFKTSKKSRPVDSAAAIEVWETSKLHLCRDSLAED